MAVVTAHPRAMHSNLATMEADLSFGPAPAVADAAFATTMRRAGELLCLLAKHLFDGSDPGRCGKMSWRSLGDLEPLFSP